MNKFALTTAAAVVAVAIITPKFISTKVADQITTAVENVNLAYGYQAEINDLHSNWFNTQASVRISVDLAELGIDSDAEDLEDLYVDIAIDASHGPILLSKHNFGLIDLAIRMEDGELRQHIDWQADVPIYHASMYTDLTGKTHFSDSVAPFTFNDEPNNTSVDYKGYSGTGSNIDGVIHYHGISEPLLVTGEDNNVAMSGMSFEMTAKATLAEIFQGKMHDSNALFKIASITAADEEDKTIAEIDNVAVDIVSELNRENRTANMVVGYNVKSIKTENEHIQDIAFNIEINHLSDKFIEAYKQNQHIFTQGTEEEIQANIITFVDDNLLTLLEAEPEFNITALTATFNDGTVMSQLNTRIKGVKAMPNITENPMFWLNHLVANGEFQGDKAVIERFAVNQVASQIKADPNAASMTEEEIASIAKQQAPFLLQTFIQQGFIVKTDSGYQAKFDIVDRILKVNDVQIPLPF
ncbi:DUF945 family protein [Thalassotalea sp. LPB0316]|uniref:DUF945 family protein n=1 Tax=Thalassotalea sp. LPB0316 TaxID=2769490 RepID=UPI00186909AC|nr:DUF945 family protein [Thalassotalea sp. LPB0316]QOL24340.1 DUF945 family protein [Thalassotalea sp. LPB0316]